MKPDISFIFVNFHSADLLSQSLSSVARAARLQGISSEYIIVNNDPGEKPAIDALGAHEAAPNIVHQSTNRGFGPANNVGARIATGEVLFFVNPDAEILSGDLGALLRTFHSHPRALLGMALSRATGERERWSSGVFPSLFQIALSYAAPEFLPQPWRAQEIERTDWVSGAAFAIRHDFFSLLGGFDETFFLYFEDVDLARRAAEAGGWAGVYPAVEFRHAGGQSHQSLQEKKRAYYAAQRRYFKKWRPAYEFAILAFGQRIRSLFL